MNASLDHAIIVLPTYNERENIKALIQAIFAQQKNIFATKLSVLVVDDSSPDGTGAIVKGLRRKYKNLHLITGKKQGLGSAYIRGFQYAMKRLKADIVLEMDADFSHNPTDIVSLIASVQQGNDFVIGSRYISGGSVDKNWSLLRKINSKAGNAVARFAAGLGNINDCTGGFRAMRASLLKKIDFNDLHVQGYAFQIALLYHAKKAKASIVEVPIYFSDRVHGESKIRTADIAEFLKYALTIRIPKNIFQTDVILSFIVGMLLSVIFFTLYQLSILTFVNILMATLFVFAVVMITQGIFFLYLMIYAWEDEDRIHYQAKMPKKITKQRSFTALIPARHEEAVIGDTIRAVNEIDYPNSKKEAIIICRTDDKKTIASARRAIKQIGNKNIQLLTFSSLPINKPHALNIALKHVTKDIIVIFDAEDSPNKQIYKNVNAVFEKENADVVQSGVQLMNFRSSWYSLFNVLEYYFWFKSSLHYFAKQGVIPLGGNSVFFKTSIIKKQNGWDETCLTEDADIGLRLSMHGAKIAVAYNEGHATQEETPHSIKSFIKQRTRWNQGFIQIFAKGEWKELSSIKQKAIAGYILLLPELQAMFFLLIPLSIIATFTLELPILFAMLTIMPLLILFLQLVTLNVGLFEFTRSYNLKYPIWMPFMIFLFFYPYQIILGLSAVRAVYRMISGNMSWEKTLHTNAHREQIEFKPSLQM